MPQEPEHAKNDAKSRNPPGCLQGSPAVNTTIPDVIRRLAAKDSVAGRSKGLGPD